MFRPLVVAAALCLVCSGLSQPKSEFGHSHLGPAFDSGLRTKPWKFEGIGKAPFPISTKNPEMQPWYDQGNVLLHNFWFEEAERSFRWCLKLDPDNAMVYFGLARCGLQFFTIGNPQDPQLDRFRQFLKKAVKRKDTVTERERMYIEAWDAGFSQPGETAAKTLAAKLQDICIRFPNDIEAKSQLAFYNMGQGSALANEFLIQQVLAVNPEHPGAHHAQTHNWDGENGEQALASCEVYGKIAPESGHALHMPGHIYSGMGMWHEAAIAMDSATRTELRHMTNRLALPFESWNYPHNRDYLSYIQEQLGRPEASILGSRDIIRAPKDPGTPLAMYPTYLPLVRALIKFEMWERILDEKTWPNLQTEDYILFKQVAQIMAQAELGQKEKAREGLALLKGQAEKMISAEIAKTPDQADIIRKQFEEYMPSSLKVVEAKVLMAEGKRLEGFRVLLDLVEKERVNRDKGMYSNDPPSDPWPAVRLVGDAYLEGGDTRSAIEAYEQALSYVKNDAWSLAGLAKAYVARGDRDKATQYASRFLAVWSGAEPNLKLMKEVLALNLPATPKGETLRPERPYDPSSLERFGPSNWQPFAAPDLDCVDTNGKRVRLTDFRGKNILLVFYLSDQCVHCVEQLGKINDRLSDFSDLNTVVLGVSAATPQSNKDSLELKPFGIKLLTDVKHANARRYASYDDFEEMELHSTILIDGKGRLRWKKSGGDPFMDVDYLINEITGWEK